MAGLDGGGYGLAVDLGTSHTVAVLRWPDGRTRPLLFDGQPILPSGVFLDPTGRAYAGRDAQRMAQADPARYEPNPKRRIDESAVLLGDREVPTVDLLAAVLRTVADAAVEAVGFLPPAVLTFPTTWGTRRREALAAAVARAGWPPVTNPHAAVTSAPEIPAPRTGGGGTLLVPEPVAAARYFADVLRRPVPVGSALAVFDLGGGTLDIAVVRNEGVDDTGRPRFVVIGSGGIADLGGLDLDAALVQHLGTVVGVAHAPVWQQLDQPTTASQWRNRRQFWDDVRGAKEMLSRSATAPVPVPGIEQALHLTRDELEEVVTPLLRRGVHETATVIAHCRLSVDQLAGLFLVGGSSRVPLVARLLHAELGIAPTVLEQPELPVAEGALAELPPPAASPGTGVAAPAGHAPTSPAYGTPHAPTGPAYGAPTAPTSPAQHGPAQHGTATLAPAPTGPAYPQQAGGLSYPQPAGPTGWAALLRRRVLWIGAGAVVALLAVVVATVLYLVRDPNPPLDFASFSEVGRIETREPSRTGALTAMGHDRAYVGYQRADNRFDIAVVNPGTATVDRWFTTEEPADRWTGLRALPGVLVLRADANGYNVPGRLVGYDPATGGRLWSRELHNDDEVHYFDGYVALFDKTNNTVVGINARTGAEWSLPSPKGDYSSDSAVHPMHTVAEFDGAADTDGEHTLPNRGDDARLVEIGADRSVRVIDVTSGRELRSRQNAADTDDLVLAYDNQLFVAPKSEGYGLVRFDLANLGTPATLYTAPDTSRRPVDLQPCGEKQVCLLETAGSDAATAQLVAVRTDEPKVAWRRDVPQADHLRPVGRNILVRAVTPKQTSRLFTPDGTKTLDRDGVALRVDGGNLLVFDDALTTYPGDVSVAGVSARDGGLTQLGPLKKVASTSCSWNRSVLVCAAESAFVVTRFTAG